MKGKKVQAAIFNSIRLYSVINLTIKYMLLILSRGKYCLIHLRHKGNYCVEIIFKTR